MVTSSPPGLVKAASSILHHHVPPSLAVVTGICRHAAELCCSHGHSPPCHQALPWSQAFTAAPLSLAVVMGIRHHTPVGRKPCAVGLGSIAGVGMGERKRLVEEEWGNGIRGKNCGESGTIAGFATVGKKTPQKATQTMSILCHYNVDTSGNGELGCRDSANEVFTRHRLCSQTPNTLNWGFPKVQKCGKGVFFHF